MGGACDLQVIDRADRFTVQRCLDLWLLPTFIRRDTQRQNRLASSYVVVVEPHAPDRHLPGKIAVLRARHLKGPVAIAAFADNESDAARGRIGNLFPQPPL